MLPPKQSDKEVLQESYFVASQWQLMWRKFTSHKLAMVGSAILIFLYLVAIFAEFLSPYDPQKRYTEFINCPPQRIRLFDRGEGGRFSFRPFVYGWIRGEDPVSWRRIYTPDESKVSRLVLFRKVEPYKLIGVFTLNVRFVGVEEGVFFLLGTDRLGRDLLTRTIHAARISMSIGLVGVALSFVLGSILGGISGYYGGSTDMLIQRIIEFIISIPTLPLWMALSAALPIDWPGIRIYFGITIILSLFGWAGLARTVRGKLISLREEDFVMAAKICGAGSSSIIARHLIPSFLSYLIVNITLSIPGMILGETALSFLGLGIQPPTVSWGTLMQDAQNVRTLVHTPWLMIPGVFVIIVVLCFNFVGDGLRDAADPYK